MGQAFYVEGCSGYDDVDVEEEMDVSKVKLLVNKANILVSKASKLITGTRIFKAI